MTSLNRDDRFVADRSLRLSRPDRELIEGKINKSRGSSSDGGGRAQSLSQKLSKRTKGKRGRQRSASPNGSGDFDRRQRAIVKIHYFNHAGGGAAGLKAHAKYVARDAAAREEQEAAGNVDRQDADQSQDRADQARAHASYLNRNGRSAFYDARSDGVDGAASAEAWAKSDIRHFRIILSAEEGARIADMPSYTRQVMARAGAALNTSLSWVAVDHHDTDNPHTHIIVRGRRANGQDLVMPREFIQHGFRNIARDVATEWLGERTRDDDRRALDREVRRHAPTRLDRMIKAQVKEDGLVRAADLKAPNDNPAVTQALKGRLHELERLGLAERLSSGVFRMVDDWHGRLRAMELHLDIRKRVVRERTEQRTQQRSRDGRGFGR